MPTTSKPKCYKPRHPERTLLYQTVAEHYESWLELASAGQFDGQGDHHTPKPFAITVVASSIWAPLRWMCRTNNRDAPPTRCNDTRLKIQ